jgi:hypothetical protein
MTTAMDAVLPLTLKDYDRSLILRRSLSEFFHDLGTLFVVTPDDQHNEIRERVKRHAHDALCLEVLPETEVVPELRHFRATGGWYRQQLVKLAVFERVRSDFYLTLDADVIATRPVSSALLTPEGRALCLVRYEDLHPVWYQRAAEVFGEPLRRTGISHNVTPAVLARHGVEELAVWLGERWRVRRFAAGHRGMRQRLARLLFGRNQALAPWRLYLTAALPWTEYALYYSFLELRDRFTRYHQEHERGISYEPDSFWDHGKSNFEEWPHRHLFQGEGPPFFTVVQSNTGVTPEQVRWRLRDRLSFD